MKAIRTDGKHVELRDFQAICGTRFKSITLTYDDTLRYSRYSALQKIHWYEWFYRIFITRLHIQPRPEEIKMNDELEQELKDKGLTAPRITPEMLDESIVSEEYHVFDSTPLTVCVLTLKNGFTVTGYSACVSLENFDKETGEKISRKNAREQIWGLLGFSLAEKLADNPCIDNTCCGGCSGG